MKNKEDTIEISIKDLNTIREGYERAMAKYNNEHETPLRVLFPFVRGLSSHKPEMREGYAILVRSLLSVFKDKIKDSEVIEFLQNFKFTHRNNKSSQRTAQIAEILSNMLFYTSGIMTEQESKDALLIEIFNLVAKKPSQQPFAYACAVECVLYDGLECLDLVREHLDDNFNGLFFWFKLSMCCPKELREKLPKQFQKSTFNEDTADLIFKGLEKSSQPWTYPIFEFIVQNAHDEELRVFWPMTVGKAIRSIDKGAIVKIVNNVLPKMKPSQYPLVIQPTFIRLVNELPDDEALAFLDSLLAYDNRLIRDNFRYIDARHSVAYQFHKNLYKKTPFADFEREITILIEGKDFQSFCASIDHKVRNEEKFKQFRMKKAQALFVATALHGSIQTTKRLFDFLLENTADKTALEEVLIDYDKTRNTANSPSLPQLVGANVSHFDACVKLQELLSGTLQVAYEEPPHETEEQLFEILLTSVKHAQDPSLIRHAYRYILSESGKNIPVAKISQFISELQPIPEEFTNETIEMLAAALTNVDPTMELVISMFELFCKVINNCGPIIAKNISKQFRPLLKERKKDFSFHILMKRLYNAMFSISNNTMNQHEKLIEEEFLRVFLILVKSLGAMNDRQQKTFQKYIKEILTDFSFKTTQRFTESIITQLTHIGDNALGLMLPPFFDLIPEVKRLARRVVLMSVVTALLTRPKGMESLPENGAKFNGCIIALLNEGTKTKDDERKMIKMLKTTTKWFQLIEKRREACRIVNTVGIRKACQNMLNNTKNEKIYTSTKSFLAFLTKIESHVHQKERDKANFDVD